MVLDGLSVRETAVLLELPEEDGQDPGPPGPDRDAEGVGMSVEHASMRIIDGYARRHGPRRRRGAGPGGPSGGVRGVP
jgi:hypothetical protein